MPINSHYIPQEILDRFSDRKGNLSVFRIPEQKLVPAVSARNVFSEKGFYSGSLESLFGEKLEGRFGRLLTGKLLRKDGKIFLLRGEMLLLKKFLLASLLRTKGVAEFVEEEKELQQIEGKLFPVVPGDPRDPFLPPFEERRIEGESDEAYWERTLRCVLASETGLPEDLAKDPLCTIMAWRWASTVNSGFVAFWDSDGSNDEFMITDVGMTSENEVGWSETSPNHLKMDALVGLSTGDRQSVYAPQSFWRMAVATVFFHENFMVFPMSAKRSVVLVSPFFRLESDFKISLDGLVGGLRNLTNIGDPRLFCPNEVIYFLPQTGMSHVFSERDLYCCEPKSMAEADVEYVNSLMMDRAQELMGFSSLGKVRRSVECYRRCEERMPVHNRGSFRGLYLALEKMGK